MDRKRTGSLLEDLNEDIGVLGINEVTLSRKTIGLNEDIGSFKDGGVLPGWGNAHKLGRGDETSQCCLQ